MSNTISYKIFDQLSIADFLVYTNLPKHSFWSYIEEHIDFSFADRLCSVLYTGRGQRPFAPSLKLKIHLVQTYYVLSDRQTEEKIIGDLFIKRFLKLPVDFFGFDHSTIGLDRQRMGTDMFQACHLYVLAQMYSLGLWGDREERWIIDSFPTHASVVMLGAYRLIQRAALQLVNHLKRWHNRLYLLASETLDLKPLTVRLAAEFETKDRLLAFSKLAALGHALLHFFETDRAIQLFSGDKLKTVRLRSMALQHTLARALQENSRPASSDDNVLPPSGGEEADAKDMTLNESKASTMAVPSVDITAEVTTESETPAPASQEDVISFEKIPHKERPTDRLVSPFHPDVRKGMKTVFKMILGFKMQNLCTECGVILNTKVIPAIEHDREAMIEMIREISATFYLKPKAILGDTAYGHGKQRAPLEALGIPVIAPVPTAQNPTSLYDISRFTYDPQKNVFRCPGDRESCKKHYNKQSNGTQYYFSKQDCAECPLQKECTTRADGRSVFRSDFAELYEKATELNNSSVGKEAMSKRYVVERKNQELKNDCGMGAPNATSQKTIGIRGILAGIAVNLKLVVRVLSDPKPGFLRRTANAR